MQKGMEFMVASQTYYWWPVTPANIKHAAQKIANAVKPQKIILFGSFAYGHPTPDSDVDLLIVTERAQNRHACSKEISELLYPRPFPVDLLVRTPKEIAERLKLRDCFIQEVMTKGKVLYERPSR